jgi:phosphate transport system permease protein
MEKQPKANDNNKKPTDSNDTDTQTPYSVTPADSINQTDHTTQEIDLPQAGAIASAVGNHTSTGFNLTPGKVRINPGDRIFNGLIRTIVIIVLLIMAGIFAVLVIGAAPAIGRYGLGFLFHDGWDPVKLEFGAFPFIVCTILVAVTSLILAGVVGLATAIYITEYAPLWLREPVAYLIELLAFIPSVVYGLWGLLVMAPWLQQTIQPWLADNLGFIPFFNGAPYGVGIMAASLILSIMLLPLIVSLSREALLLVPDAQKEAMYALGATKWEVIRQAVVPYARVGIGGAIIISLGRALGETMAVAMTIGGGFQIPKTILDQGYTLSSIIANEVNEVSSDTYLSALIYCGLLLFIVTVLVNIGAYLLLQRFAGPRGIAVKA